MMKAKNPNSPKSKIKQENQKKSEEKKWVRWLGPVALYILSAFGGAILESATKVVQDSIAPVMATAACRVRETFASNNAPDRFTVVVLRFADDGDHHVSQTIAAKLAEKYGINAIESCIELSVPASGDRAKNISEIRNRVARLIDKYDADMVILGTAKGKDSEISSTNKTYLKYLFNDKYADDFDRSSPEEYVDSIQFKRELIDVADENGSSSRCIHPLYIVCNVGNKVENTQRLLRLLSRLRYVEEYYTNNHYIVPILGPDVVNKVDKIAVLISSIAVNLYSFHGIKEVKTEGKAEDILEVADHALLHLELVHENDKSLDEILGRASIDNIWAQQCGYGQQAIDAMNGFEDALQMLNSPFSDKVSIIASLLGLGRAQMLTSRLTTMMPTFQELKWACTKLY